MRPTKKAAAATNVPYQKIASYRRKQSTRRPFSATAVAPAAGESHFISSPLIHIGGSHHPIFVLFTQQYRHNGETTESRPLDGRGITFHQLGAAAAAVLLWKSSSTPCWRWWWLVVGDVPETTTQEKDSYEGGMMIWRRAVLIPRGSMEHGNDRPMYDYYTSCTNDDDVM
jgi:hypothetical protein